MLENIAKQVVSARHGRDLSLSALSDLAQISETELQALESGDGEQILEWSVSKIKRLAEALDINLSRLMGESILDYGEWALIWSALIEYSANRPGLEMKTDMKDLILKVQSFIPDHQLQAQDG